MDNNQRFESKEAIFDFVYHMAMNDATSQKAFSGKKCDIENNVKVKGFVREYIDDVLFKEDKADVMKTAHKIGNALGRDSGFTFGNIQKLINMCAKYMYIACYANEDLRFKFQKCDCPMDAIMIHNVRMRYKSLYAEKGWSKELLQIPYSEGQKGEDGSLISWSKICFENTNDPKSIEVYNKFQEMVILLAEEDGICPIEYDYKEWSRTE